jgi:hypothetical protein
MLSTNQKNLAVTLLSGALLIVLSIELVAQAQPAPEVALDRLFRNESSALFNASAKRMVVMWRFSIVVRYRSMPSLRLMARSKR